MVKNNAALFFGLLLALCSCSTEELPVPAYDGEALLRTIEMTNSYERQIYFDLGKNTVVAENNKTDWDLALDLRPGSFYVYQNSAVAMQSQVLEDSAFYKSHRINMAEIRADPPHGIEDSLVLGDARGLLGKTVLVHRGYDADGRSLGEKKIQFTEVSNTNYKFRIANLDASDLREIEVPRQDSDRARVMIGLDSGNVMFIEPAPSEYDLIFTQYTYIFYNPMYTPYLVTGVQLNRPGNVSVAVDTSHNFEEISMHHALDMKFSDNLDAIGYDWKDYSFETSRFTVYSHYNYIVKDGEFNYFKLRFTSFYNESGERGYPQIEFTKL